MYCTKSKIQYTSCSRLQSRLIRWYAVSWTENPHLSFRGIGVSTFLRLFYDTFHRDRAVRQLLLTAFQYLRMRPASGWDRVRRSWTLLPSSLATGNESDMVVRGMSDDMIKSWTWLTKSYANVGVLFRKHETREGLNSSRLISWKNDLHLGAFAAHFLYCDVIHYVTLLPHPQKVVS